jgi:hypothetical protein
VGKRLLAIVLTLVAASAALASPVAAKASCTAQFTSALAPLPGSFGQLVVKPEVFSLSLGGPNLGQEVKLLFATADRDACPVVPMP